MKFIKKYSVFLGIGIVLALSVFAILPFLQSGFFPMHDDTQVARVFEMGKSLKDGMFPVRWVQDLGYGYGYPIFNFYAPLAYYVGGMFVVIGQSALLATKLMFVIGILLAGITMYLFAREFWGELGGILSALLYQYAIYHAVDIYVRGDVGEFWAYASIPLVFLGIYKIYQKLNEKDILGENSKFKIVKVILPWTILGSVSYASVILSHNLTAMMVTPFLLGFIFVLVGCTKKERRFTTLHQMLHVIFFGLLLSAFYWLPAVSEMKYTNVLSQIGGGADFHTHFICLSQLWYSPWGYGGSTGGCMDGLSFMLGKIPIALGILGLLGLLWRKKTRGIGLLLGIGLSISIFFMLQYSQFLWDVIKPMAFFQYPWRFLLVVNLFLALLGGAIIISLQAITSKKLVKYTPFVMSIAVLAIIFFQSKYFVPQKINPVTSDYYTNRYMLTFTTSKISDEYLPKSFIKPQNFSQVPASVFRLIDTPGFLKVITNNTRQKSAEVTLVMPGKLFVAITPFPAWHISVDGKKIEGSTLADGFLVGVPKGKHTVTVAFKETFIETMSSMISFASLLVVIIGIIYYTAYVYHQANR